LAVRVLARAHQAHIWTRQRQANQLRNALREFYPASLEILGTDLDGKMAVALLSVAPTPARGRHLSRAQIRSALSRAGLQRSLDEKAALIQQQLREEQLEAPPAVAQAFGAIVASAVKVIRALNEEISDLETELTASFEAHLDAAIIRSLPGLGTVLGARFWLSSATTELAMPMPSVAKTTQGQRPSPRRQESRRWCWRASFAIATLLTPRTCGRSAR
jgi:hypothetical protein